jgi:hypothetical protein
VGFYTELKNRKTNPWEATHSKEAVQGHRSKNLREQYYDLLNRKSDCIPRSFLLS